MAREHTEIDRLSNLAARLRRCANEPAHTESSLRQEVREVADALETIIGQQRLPCEAFFRLLAELPLRVRIVAKTHSGGMGSTVFAAVYAADYCLWHGAAFVADPDPQYGKRVAAWLSNEWPAS